jgi:hypothetical protein
MDNETFELYEKLLEAYKALARAHNDIHRHNMLTGRLIRGSARRAFRLSVDHADISCTMFIEAASREGQLFANNQELDS